MTIKIKKKQFKNLLLLEMYISQLEISYIFEKRYWIFKGTAICSNKCDSKSMIVFVWRRHSFQPVTSNMSRYQSFPRGWLSESFPGGNKKNTSRWKRPKGRPRTAWIWSVENDLTPQNISLHSNLRQAKIDRARVKLLHVICQWWWWYLW